MYAENFIYLNFSEYPHSWGWVMHCLLTGLGKSLLDLSEIIFMKFIKESIQFIKSVIIINHQSIEIIIQFIKKAFN